MWGNMREWLQGGSIPRDQELIDDLIGVEYGFTPTNKIQLEKKEDMKKRGLASPDLADGKEPIFSETGLSNCAHKIDTNNDAKNN